MSTNGHRSKRTWVAGAGAVLLLALVTGACGGIGGGDDADQAVARAQLPSAAATSDEGTAATANALTATKTAGGSASASGADGGVGAPLPAGLGEPKVVKTASIDVEVADGGFDAAFSKVPTIAAGNGGFVASSSSTSSGGDDEAQAAGTVVVRVPSANFDATRQQLIGLGTLRSQQLRGDDVSGQLTDLDARLKNLRSQEEAIRLLMTKAGTIGETIEVQRQLSTVREEIERLAGEQARLTDAVSYSTLTVSLAEPGVVVERPTDPSSVRQAVTKAWDGAQSVVAAAIVVLGYLVPLALLVGLGLLALRPFLPSRRHASEPAVSS
jgi:hypothetical protein